VGDSGGSMGMSDKVFGCSIVRALGRRVLLTSCSPLERQRGSAPSRLAWASFPSSMSIAQTNSPIALAYWKGARF
jgi:hypothetical protein